MFIEPDERLIIMDLAGKNAPLSLSNFQELESVGVRTIEFSVLTWLDLSWQIIYNKIEDIFKNTNLKILCPFWWTPPTNVNWLLDDEINYADPAVGKSIDEVTLRFLDGLGNARDRVQVNYAYYTGGEVAWKHYPYRLLPNTVGQSSRQAEPPPVSDERVAEFIVERQKILSSQHNEVWTSLLNTMCAAHHPRRMIIDNALYDAYPDCNHYRIQHWYFPCMTDDVSCSLIRNNPKSKYFVGSEWVQGLETNYAAGMEQGVWGFITAPIHPHSRESKLNNEMLAIIKVAIEKLSLEKEGE
jgi:hypothetical protein